MKQAKKWTGKRVLAIIVLSPLIVVGVAVAVVLGVPILLLAGLGALVDLAVEGEVRRD